MTPKKEVNKNKKRIGVFIDGSNIWHCQKKNKWRIDFHKLKWFFYERGDVKDIYYFTPEAPHIKKFLSTLDKIGYVVIKKPLKQIKLRQKGKPVNFKYKGNLDMEMGLMMATNLDKYDEYIIMSGDSDFEVVVKLLKTNGKNIIVICNRDVLSIEMRKISNKVIYLYKVKSKIEYKSRLKKRS